MTEKVTDNEYTHALLTLEIARDAVDTTPDETEVLREAHAIIQEYRRAGEL